MYWKHTTAYPTLPERDNRAIEATEDEPGSQLQVGEAEPDSWWDTFAFWNWGSEDKLEEFKKKRAARPKQDGEKVGPRKIRNKDMVKGLLRERE